MQNLLHGIFHDFPVSSSVGNKKSFRTKYGHQLSFYIWVTRLVFKIDAIDGKKWVKFVGMQLNAAAFIYDLNTKNSIAIQRQYTSKFDISHLILKAWKKLFSAKLFWASLTSEYFAYLFAPIYSSYETGTPKERAEREIAIASLQIKTLASHPNGRLWKTKKKPYNYR